MIPKITSPIYELNLPSNGTTVQFRPYLVKEEKLLLMATESGEPSEIVNTTKQIINNCLISKLDIDSLPAFDVDYLFLNMRAKSIGDKIEQTFVCGNIVEQPDKKCNNEMVVDIAISDIKITGSEPEKKIQLSKNFGIVMKYPRFKTYKNTDEDVLGFEILIECMDYVYDANQTYKIADQTYEETVDFLESLTKEQFQKLQDFYDNIPILHYEKKHTCDKCGFEHTLRVDNPLSFF